MTRARSSVFAAVSIGVYRALLWAYPQSFRAAYRQDLVETFSDRLDAVLRERGPRGLPVFWLRTLRDIVTNATGARAQQFQVAITGGGRGPHSQRKANLMENLFQDLGYGLRSLRKNLGFAAVVVFTLALGIGANVAIFSVVHAVLLTPLPYGSPERLAMVWGFNPGIGREVASLPDFLDWRDQNTTFAGMSAVVVQSVNLTDADPGTERVRGARVSDGFFQVMGVAPFVGRAPTTEEDIPGAERVVVLGYGLWQRRFGGDTAVVGRAVDVHGNMHVVIGIAPPGFDFPREVDLWMPLALDPTRFGRRGDFLTVVGRLGDGVSLDEAQTEMTTIAARLEEEYPQSNADWTVQLVSLHEQIVGNIRLPLLAFLGAVGFVLLIVCANVANLLLARAAARSREMAFRSALGAGRSRLMGQLLTETGLLAVIGGGVGLLLAKLGRLEGAGVEGPVFLFALAVTVGTGLLFGVAPALQASRTNIAASLRQGGSRAADGSRSFRFRSALVVSQVALAIVLLVGAGLMMRSFMELQRVDPGFDPGGVATMRLSLPGAQYPDAEAQVAFYRQLSERTSGLPGVARVGLVSDLPAMGGGNYLSFAVEGRPPPSNAVSMVQDAHVSTASFSYFRTVGIPMMRGRGFTDQDRSGAEAVAVINETMVRQYWPDEDPIGQRITFGSPQTGPWMTVVGVVGDIKDQGLDSEPYAQVYRPFAQNGRASMTAVVKAESDLSALIAAARRQVREIDPALAVYAATPLAELVSGTIAQPRFNFLLTTVLAAAAIVLAAVGLYGVMSYSVAERSGEIGVRMALGATQSAVLRQVVGQGAILVVFGGAIGVVASVFVTRLISTLLFGVQPGDPLTYFGVVGVLAVVVGAASYIPAFRASRVDPMVVLREE
jgi:putative ABC transport system permease protein